MSERTGMRPVQAWQGTTWTHLSDPPHFLTRCGRPVGNLRRLVGEQALSRPFCEECHPLKQTKETS